MDSLSGKDFIKFLNTIGIDAGHISSESVDWFFYKPEIKNIVTWLCRYINENNILTPSEIYEQELLLKNNGEIYKGEKFDQKIQEINNTYPGIFEITSNEIVILEKELDKELEKEKMIDKLTTNYLTLDYKIQQKLTKLENDEINTRAQRDAVTKDCLKLSKKIDETQQQIQDNMKKKLDILLNYQHKLDEKYFISQMPLETYKSREENFCLYLYAYIAKEFDNEDQNQSVDNSMKSMSESFVIGQEYIRLYKDIQNSIISRTKSECEVVELEARLKFLRQNLNRKQCDKRVKLLQFKGNAKMQSFETLCETELKEAVEKYTRNLINNVLYLVVTKKLECCRKTIDKLQVLYKEIQRVISFNALLVLFYKWEEQQIESTLKFLSQSHYYLMNYQKNLLEQETIMTEIENQYKIYAQTRIEQKHKIITDILKITTGNSKDDNINISDALKIVRQRKSNIEKLKYELFTIEKQKYKKTVKEMDAKIKEIQSCIESGPTMQPVIIPYSFIQTMFKSLDSIQKVTDKLNISMKKVKETETALNNEWLKNKQLLYVWFLINPKKLLNVTKQLEDYLYAQNTNIELPEKTEEVKLIDI